MGNWISANTDECDKKEMLHMIITDQQSWRNWWRGVTSDTSIECENHYTSTIDDDSKFSELSEKCSVEADINDLLHDEQVKI